VARHRRILLGRALLAASAAVAVAVTGSLVLLGSGAVPAEAKLVLCAAVVAAGLWAARLGLRGSHAGPAAAIVRSRDPGLYDDLAGAEALARDGVGQGASVDLARAHVSRALDRIREGGPGRLTTGATIRAGVAAWSAAAPALVLAALLSWPALVRGAAVLFSPPSSLDDPAVADGPLAGDLELTLEFPAYLRRAPLEIVGSTGDVEAPVGTRVRIRARAIGPISSAAIRLDRGPRVGMRTVGRRMDGEFLVRQDDRWVLQVVRPDGRTLRESRPRNVDALADAPPRVEILDPAADLTLAPTEALRGRFRATDDVGVAAAWLVVSVSGRPDDRRALALGAQTSADSHGDFEVSLSELGVRGGDVVAISIEAEDEDSVSGPNRGVSETRTIEVASEEARHEALVAEQDRVLDALVAALGDRLEIPVPAGDAPAGIHARFERVRGASDEALRALAWSGEGLATDELSRRDVPAALHALRAKLGRIFAREARLHGDPPAALGERAELDRLAIGTLEDAVLLLADLLARQRLEALERIGGEVRRSRQRLQELVARWELSRADAVRREILSQIERLEAQVADLYDRLERIAPRVPAEFLNAEAIRRIDLLGELGMLRESLAAGDVRGARAALESLEGRMRELMSALEGSTARFSGDRFAEADRARRELLTEVEEVEGVQRDVARRTEGTAQALRRRLDDHMRARVDPLVARLVGRTDAALRSLDAADPESVPESSREDLARARERILDLRALLTQHDLEEARAMALAASEELRELDRDLANLPADFAAPALSRAVSGARPPLDEVADALAQAVPDPRTFLREADGRALRGEGGLQRGLADRVGALRRRLEEPGGELPFLGPDAARLLGDAEDRMRSAAERLADADARGAVGEQDAALERLRRVRESAESAARPAPVGSAAVGGRVPRIPRADEHRGPEELRRRILEALREAPPGPYADDVRRYLEDLAR